MNNDLISRSALRKAFEEVYPLATNEMGGVANKRIYDIIDNAPTVAVDEEIERQREELYQSCKKLFDTARMLGVERPQDKWIPVSERLPEIEVDVIVTDIETTGTYSACYMGDGFWDCDNGTFKNRVIAWQPFPKPYKKGEEE